MRNIIFTAVFALALTTPVLAQNIQAEEKVSDEKILYSLGYFLGNNLKTQLLLDNEEAFKAVSQGLRDSLLNRNSQTDLETYKPLVIKKYEDDGKKILASYKAGQKKFVDDAKKDKKSKTLGNGAVIQTIKKGKGKSPKASDTVKVHYEGSLIDGTVFDSSVKRGQPAQFPLNGVISCWTQALQEMSVGEKAKLICPSETAYSDNQAGTIPPGSTLIFEVELLDVSE